MSAGRGGVSHGIIDFAPEPATTAVNTVSAANHGGARIIVPPIGSGHRYRLRSASRPSRVERRRANRDDRGYGRADGTRHESHDLLNVVDDAVPDDRDRKDGQSGRSHASQRGPRDLSEREVGDGDGEGYRDELGPVGVADREDPDVRTGPRTLDGPTVER